MNKTELVSAIIKAEKEKGNDLPKGKAESILSSTLEIIRDEVKTNGKVQLIGFGTFSRLLRKARAGVNPATKQPIQIAEKNVAKFKPSSTFLD